MKRNDSKDIKRIKKMYPIFKDGYFVESIKDFLSLDWVKRFKNVGKFKKHPLEKQWLKQLNHKKRTSAKKEIQEGIKEWEDIDCSHCCNFFGEKCEKFNIL